MELQTYRRKRDFRRTPEPRGKAKSFSRNGRAYAIQQHAARRLHYDFRLELNGALVSWAVPKGPSLDPHEKRLAVHVEDHPIEYGDFEGIIPPGQYGSGTVLLWDRGRWIEEGDAETGLRQGKLKFRLEGDKLRGGWTLVRMNGRANANEKENWLLIKEKDKEADPSGKRDILQERPESVASGRTLEEIREAADREWQSDKKDKKKNRKIELRRHLFGTIDPGKLAGARPSALPEFFRPQLASIAEEVPQGDDWLHEIKYDGYRAICRIENGAVRFFTRAGNDWTSRFSKLAQEARRLPVKAAYLDGEIVVVQPDGSTNFQALQNVLKRGDDENLVYFVFDLVYLEGYDLKRVPLLERKQTLAKLLENVSQNSAIRFGGHLLGRGELFYQHACQYELEGVISKLLDAPYRAGRTRDWVKVKCLQRQEFVIGGYTNPSGTRKGFGALLLGVHDAEGALKYSGRVGTGFTEESLLDLYPRLKALEQKSPAFANPPTGAARRGVHWIQPKLVAEIEFRDWTRDRIIRHASFQGLREDKAAIEVVKEEPIAANAPEKTASKNGNKNSKIAGMRLSNPERVLYPDQGITKRELALYYEAIADWILPHLKNRSLSLVRCPEGYNKECFYQKHAKDTMDQSLRRVDIREDDGVDTYLAVDSLRGLIALVQLGVLELHTWGSRVDQIEKPDRLIFDLDPDPAVSWPAVVEAAHALHEHLQTLGFAAFVKTTGGKGLHIVVPLRRRQEWDEVKEFSAQVAKSFVRQAPKLYTATMSKAKRKGKIFIDHFRNGRGATAIAAYSTRARNEAPVSTPIRWEELDEKMRSDHYNIHNLPERLAKLRRDPWQGYEKARRAITAEMKEKVSS